VRGKYFPFWWLLFLPNDFHGIWSRGIVVYKAIWIPWTEICKTGTFNTWQKTHQPNPYSDIQLYQSRHELGEYVVQKKIVLNKLWHARLCQRIHDIEIVKNVFYQDKLNRSGNYYIVVILYVRQELWLYRPCLPVDGHYRLKHIAHANVWWVYNMTVSKE
jgi:hypothetical protein